MYFRIKLAGTVYGITAENEYTGRICRGYLTEEPPDYEIAVTGEDIAAERRMSAESDKREGRPVREYSDGYLESLAVYRRICECAAMKNTLLFHSSALAVDGKAYLFAAPSGTGKSTHARLWREYLGSRVTMINDDKPLLTISPDEVRVCGTPWNGKHRLGGNISAPVRAICFIERGENNSIEELPPAIYFEKLIQQTYIPENPCAAAAVIGLVGKLAGKVRIYRLRCNMDIEAAAVAYGGMAPKE